MQDDPSEAGGRWLHGLVEVIDLERGATCVEAVESVAGLDVELVDRCESDLAPVELAHLGSAIGEEPDVHIGLGEGKGSQSGSPLLRSESWASFASVGRSNRSGSPATTRTVAIASQKGS